MKVFQKAILLTIFISLLGLTRGFAQEKGEILISPGPAIKEIPKEKKEVQVQEKPKDQQADDFEKLKSYKRKIYIVYIVLFICLLYLLITYRNRKRRL